MFTYINPDIRKRLVSDGTLIRIDATGRAISAATPPPAGEFALNLLGPIPLPISHPQLETVAHWYAAVRHTELSKAEQLAAELTQQGGQRLFATLASSMVVNSVLVFGDLAAAKNPLVRVHSSCVTGDVFGSRRCECGPQLETAMRRIDADAQGGVLIYMAGHEGRGIGLWAKAVTYLLQDAGEDTYQANRSLGLPDDSREFGDAAALLHYFVGERPFRLLTNNPKKLADLHNHGLSRITAEKHVIGVGDWNRRYLEAKRDWGHKLSEDDLKD